MGYILGQVRMCFGDTLLLFMLASFKKKHYLTIKLVNFFYKQHKQNITLVLGALIGLDAGSALRRSGSLAFSSVVGIIPVFVWTRFGL